MLNNYSHTRPGIVNQATLAAHLQEHSAVYGALPVEVGVHRLDVDAAATALIELGYTWLPVAVRPGCLRGEIMLRVAG